MPPRMALEYVCEVRYGSGSWPASPYATRALPYDNHDCSGMALVNSQARLPLGNQLRRFSRPNVDEPSFLTAAVRNSWLYTSTVACPNHDALWITCSASSGRSCLTVFDNLNGTGATRVRPTVPSCRTLRVFNSCP